MTYFLYEASPPEEFEGFDWLVIPLSPLNFEEQNARHHQTLKECVFMVTKVVTMEQPGSHAARAPAWMSPSIASAKNQFQPTSHIVPGRSYDQQAQREGHTGHDHRCTDAKASAAFICGSWQNQRLSWCLTPEGEMDKLLIYFTACHQPVSHPEGQQATPGDRFFGQVMKHSWEVADFTQKMSL